MRKNMMICGGLLILTLFFICQSVWATEPCFQRDLSAEPIGTPVVSMAVDIPGGTQFVIATAAQKTAEDVAFGEGGADDADDEWKESGDLDSDDEMADDEWEESGDSDSDDEMVDDDDWAGQGDDFVEEEEKRRCLELIGKVSNKFAVDVKDDDDFEHGIHNHSELVLGVKYVPHDSFHILLSIDADYYAYNNDGDWDNDSSFRPHNSYINWSGEGFNLKAGNQIVRWGKTDGYSPLDNVNPEDLRDGIAGRREDRKQPISILNLELYWGDLALQGLYIPIFVDSDLDREGADWAIFQHSDKVITGYGIHEEDPSHTLENSEFGLRLAGIIHSIDFEVSWLYSRADLPFPDSVVLPPGVFIPPGQMTMADLLMFSSLTGQTIQLTHDRQHIYGLAFESTVGDFGIRGDIAYFYKNSFFTQTLRRVKKPECQLMLGVDYNGPKEWYGNLQFLQTLIIDYDERIVWADETLSALTGTVSKEFFNGFIKPECRFYVDLSGDAAMLNPKLIIKNWEPFVIEIGAELFDGSEETPLGIYGENDLIYTLLKYNF